MTDFSEQFVSLKEKVEKATGELERLRQENEQLLESLKVLWERTADGQQPGLVTTDGDRDAARKKIQHFISSIDMYLEKMEA